MGLDAEKDQFLMHVYGKQCEKEWSVVVLAGFITQAIARLHAVTEYDTGCWLNNRWNRSAHKNIIPT